MKGSLVQCWKARPLLVSSRHGQLRLRFGRILLPLRQVLHAKRLPYAAPCPLTAADFSTGLREVPSVSRKPKMLPGAPASSSPKIGLLLETSGCPFRDSLPVQTAKLHIRCRGKPQGGRSRCCGTAGTAVRVHRSDHTLHQVRAKSAPVNYPLLEWTHAAPALPAQETEMQRILSQETLWGLSEPQTRQTCGTGQQRSNPPTLAPGSGENPVGPGPEQRLQGPPLHGHSEGTTDHHEQPGPHRTSGSQ